MAKADTSSGDGQLKTFKTFPEFSKLKLADKDAYEALIAQYPPISDISFATLMLWWNPLGDLAVSLLNGNLIISYWLPGGEKMSGLSLVGTNKVDESICTVLDHQQERGDQAQLVHVPEFVLSYLEHPEMFRFEGERDLDEYVLALSKFYPLNHLISYRRLRVRRFLTKVAERRVSVRQVDLTQHVNQRLLLGSVACWPKQGTINEQSQLAVDALQMALAESEALGVENICLFIDDTLHAFALYQQPADKRYIIFNQAKMSYGLPYLFDYMVYVFARWFTERGISYVNLDVDYNVPMLRMVKLALGPENFFRKYTIKPTGAR